MTAMVKERELLIDMEKQTEELSVIHNVSSAPVLKNQAEIEFAKLLDMYLRSTGNTSPRHFRSSGMRKATSPRRSARIFYLPKFDTYIELTTMNQKYVTAKNKKVKKLRRLYPGVNVKIVYKKDFHSLVERFNLNKGE